MNNEYIMDFDSKNIGKNIYALVKRLFPICRSITGNGVRESLKILKEIIPITTHEIPSGTKVFDWEIPEEWNINDAYILDEEGNKIVDFQKNNLHVAGYSMPINKELDLSELQDHLFSLKELPEAIPYITSYYQKMWGFCISHNQRNKLKKGKYRVFIDSELKKGSLTYGELIIPGKLKKEILLSTYVCHPSMANDNLSGVGVTAFLAKWIANKPRKYTYRFVFIPETIGSITYLSKNWKKMKKNTIAGFNIGCVGDDKSYSFIPSKKGNSLADKVTLSILKSKHPNFNQFSYLERFSDQRQYCSPGIDLPVVSVMRTKYKEFSEYHNSLDNLNFVTANGLYGAFDLLKECLKALENNEKYKIKCLGDPQLGKRGLYPNLSKNGSSDITKDMVNFIGYADGNNDLIDISNIIKVPVWKLYPIVKKLENSNLLTLKE